MALQVSVQWAFYLVAVFFSAAIEMVYAQEFEGEYSTAIAEGRGRAVSCQDFEFESSGFLESAFVPFTIHNVHEIIGHSILMGTISITPMTTVAVVAQNTKSFRKADFFEVREKFSGATKLCIIVPATSLKVIECQEFKSCLSATNAFWNSFAVMGQNFKPKFTQIVVVVDSVHSVYAITASGTQPEFVLGISHEVFVRERENLVARSALFEFWLNNRGPALVALDNTAANQGRTDDGQGFSAIALAQPHGTMPAWTGTARSIITLNSELAEMLSGKVLEKRMFGNVNHDSLRIMETQTHYTRYPNA